MKVAITGHTKGIGKALADVFTTNGHNVIGFSKSTGFDIGDPNAVLEILDFASDCDIFINNAYVHIGQTELLKGFINKWTGQDKLIINISSKFVFQTDTPPRFQEYVANKNEQNKIIENRMRAGLPKVMNVLPGIVDTDMSSMFQADKIDAKEIADLIYSNLQYKTVMVQQLIIDVPALDWKDIRFVQ